MRKSEPANIAIFASGAGSNALKIIEHFNGSFTAQVALVVSDQPAAGVITIARDHDIPVLILEKERFFRGDAYVPDMLNYEIDFIVLAGFMRKVPGDLINTYNRRIINIHPALLPAYGGKGMYGFRVHEAVIAAKETQSGITIHYVDEIYDNGEIIFQEICPITREDTPDTLAAKIHKLEHICYPKVIESLLAKSIDN